MILVNIDVIDTILRAHGTIIRMVSYTLHAPPPQKVADTLSSCTPLQQKLLYKRGISDPLEVEQFLNPSYDSQLHDPFLLHDMDAAVSRILEALRQKEQIAIFSDYDCDGIPGAVVLHDFFQAISYERFENYIPHRHYEGFGFSVSAVEALAQRGVRLIVTVDCGMADHAAVSRARELDIDVIITDHHEQKKTLPAAHAVVNPKLGAYPFDGLCGAGVAFKLVQALIRRGVENKVFDFPPGKEKWFLDMVGIATIADMVPLHGENRVLAHYGLQVLRKSRRPGLQQLLRKQRVDQRYLTEDDIGFTIGPRINAASRMDVPEDAFHLLASRDEKQAGAYVEHLEKLNNERRGIVAAMTKQVKKRLSAVSEVPDVLVIGDPQWRPSLVGLVAGKLVEEYRRPAFLWGRDGNGAIKGSCRSNGAVNVVALMDAASDLFIEHGGHAMSGGFSVTEESIHVFPRTLNEVFRSLGEQVLQHEEVIVDAAITLDDITHGFIREQNALAPFGTGNPKPIYAISAVVPTHVSTFGKGNEHLKLLFDTNGIAKEAIAFYKTAHDFHTPIEEGKELTLYVHVEESFFFGRKQTRLRLIDAV